MESNLCPGTRLHTVVIHSLLTQENFNKRLSPGIYIIYPWAVTSEVQIVFQTLKPQPRNFIHLNSRCSGDKVSLYHLYLSLSMFHAKCKFIWFTAYPYFELKDKKNDTYNFCYLSCVDIRTYVAYGFAGDGIISGMF